MSTQSIPMRAIGLDAADALIDAALAAARKIGIEVAVAVADPTGRLRAFKRSDGAPFLVADIAMAKAWTAAAYNLPTHVWNDFVSTREEAPLTALPGMMAVAGGFPIMEGKMQIGGLGVSGGTCEQDVEVCLSALRHCGLKGGAADTGEA